MKRDSREPEPPLRGKPITKEFVDKVAASVLQRLSSPTSQKPGLRTSRIGTSVMVEADRDRKGGVRHALFAVTVTKDGGSAGDINTAPTLTYTVNDLDGTQLGTTMTPEANWRPKATHDIPSNDSPGAAYRDTNGNLNLFFVAEEWPTTALVSNVKSVQVDMNNNLEYTTEEQRVLDTGTTSNTDVSSTNCTA